MPKIFAIKGNIFKKSIKIIIVHKSITNAITLAKVTRTNSIRFLIPLDLKINLHNTKFKLFDTKKAIMPEDK